MSHRFKPYEPDQILLLPPSLLDWLPEDHLVYFLADVVDQLIDSSVANRTERPRRSYQWV